MSDIEVYAKQLEEENEKLRMSLDGYVEEIDHWKPVWTSHTSSEELVLEYAYGTGYGIRLGEVKSNRNTSNRDTFEAFILKDNYRKVIHVGKLDACKTEIEIYWKNPKTYSDRKSTLSAIDNAHKPTQDRIKEAFEAFATAIAKKMP